MIFADRHVKNQNIGILVIGDEVSIKTGISVHVSCIQGSMCIGIMSIW